MTAVVTRPNPDVRELPAQSGRTPRYVLAFRIVLYWLLFMGLAWGSPLIRAAAVCALPLAVWSDWEGGVRHLLRMAGLGLAFWLAPTAGYRVGEWVNAAINVPALLGTVIGMLLVGLGVIGVIGFAARRISRQLSKRPHLNACNHIVGGVVGTAEGVLFVAVGCWLLAVFAGPIESLRSRLSADRISPQNWMIRTLFDMSAAVRNDHAGRWLARTNPLERVPAVQTVQVVAELAAEPGRMMAAIEDGRLSEIAEIPEIKGYIQAFENDPQMKEALRQGDLIAILNSGHLRAMVKDRKLHRALLARRDEIRAAVGKPDYAAFKAQARQLDAGTRPEVRDLVKRYGK